ncbi:MAG: maltose alpha-D-glucosyltransferase / alpha-amylase, partial [Actinomycetota bacterium]|nr:maltose alpha-D-glucosyltransferase / alpha-amylase [Actinomycetota bacterium]
MADRWYRQAVVYCLDVETFQDSDGDGIGDLRGLISRLDYLARLGVTCLWLNPIHPSPRRDDGYDISDFYGVHPQIGTLGDFADLLHQASNRGIRVITDLVINHTSDEHPWFQSARASRDSPYRDWYVWSDTEPSDR